MKPKMIFIFFALFTLFFIGPFVCANETDHNQIEFKWAILQHQADKSMKSIDLLNQNEIQIEPDDLIKIYFQPGENTYIYLYLYESDKTLTVLFPQKSESFLNLDYFQNDYFIPEKDKWLQFNNKKGSEKIYFIASASRLSALEKLNRDLSLSRSVIQAGRIKQWILHEIMRLSRLNVKSRMISYDLMPFAGSIRGSEQELPFKTGCFKADGLFIKTIYFQKK